MAVPIGKSHVHEYLVLPFVCDGQISVRILTDADARMQEVVCRESASRDLVEELYGQRRGEVDSVVNEGTRVKGVCRTKSSRVVRAQPNWSYNARVEDA